MKRLLPALLLLLFLLPTPVYARYDPLYVANNKYGMHIIDVNDVNDVAMLVNSSGGDWGYVTLVIQDNDRDVGKWQNVFNTLRRVHLIPIVRLATHVSGSSWEIPHETTFNEWVDFLDKLNWVIENRYVVLFNEPNHANEWGGTLNPEQYGKVFVTLGKKLKERNDDFFLLPAGLDASAPNSRSTLDMSNYLSRIVASNSDFLKLLDGWTSHSYPNPAFSASPNGQGKGSIRSYIWELSYMRSLGLTRELPVFITETGWTHADGKNYNSNMLSTQAVASYIRQAVSDVWQDPRIIAVTPFIFNYQDTPFDHFSWKKIGGANEYHSMYDSYKTTAKTEGTPHQRHSFQFLADPIPKELISDSHYEFKIPIKNIGQSIFDPSASRGLMVTESSGNFSFTVFPTALMESMGQDTIVVTAKTPATTGTYTIHFSFHINNDSISLGELTTTVVPPPSVTFTTKLGWRLGGEERDVTFLLYDGDTLMDKKINLTIAGGKGMISEVKNVIPGKTYRLVLLVPGYLPRQTIVPLAARNTNVSFPRFLPFDVNFDGKLSFGDFISLITTAPNAIIRRFF